MNSSVTCFHEWHVYINGMSSSIQWRVCSDICTSVTWIHQFNEFINYMCTSITYVHQWRVFVKYKCWAITCFISNMCTSITCAHQLQVFIDYICWWITCVEQFHVSSVTCAHHFHVLITYVCWSITYVDELHVLMSDECETSVALLPASFALCPRVHLHVRPWSTVTCVTRLLHSCLCHARSCLRV